jgi:hypothetical protein
MKLLCVLHLEAIILECDNLLVHLQHGVLYCNIFDVDVILVV